ncbi:signal peptidase II [Marinilabilia salmonicolor]|jgi:signal peptidase II|uniref:lipoprotein signal peptidase n=1 Tax=Marinilabilia salmonicolor TaxID=989 RepID=UPI000D04EED1|nr:lipoprotein signal peptidase [Marinilabilia salmonicolor]PRY94356.1 signal peptidase II [Marinilabilia salmonicolor]
MGKLKTPVIIILAILLVDQALKFWVKTNMMLGDEFSVFGDWFYIHFVENNGMAFGMELGGDFGKIFLSIFRIVAVVGIGWYLYKLTLKNAPVGLIVSVSMVLAGALGNIIDSAFYGMIFNHSYSQVATLFPEGGGYASFLHGRVVDMFYFPLFSGTYPDWFPWLGGQEYIFFRPVFNIADSSITLGIISILIFQKKFFEHEEVDK